LGGIHYSSMSKLNITIYIHILWRYDATSNEVILNAKTPNEKISKTEISKKHRTKNLEM
jgi:hypothetical protein